MRSTPGQGMQGLVVFPGYDGDIEIVKWPLHMGKNAQRKGL